MDQLEYPSADIWEKRKEWFEKELEKGQHPLASYIVSEHATTLLIDLQSCYCAGAWLAVVIISFSVIEAQLKEELNESKVTTEFLLASYDGNDDINWLRKIRNRYIHCNVENPALVIDDQYNKRKRMEFDAKRAIRMAISALFQSPGT